GGIPRRAAGAGPLVRTVEGPPVPDRAPSRPGREDRSRRRRSKAGSALRGGGPPAGRRRGVRALTEPDPAGPGALASVAPLLPDRRCRSSRRRPPVGNPTAPRAGFLWNGGGAPADRQWP